MNFTLSERIAARKLGEWIGVDWDGTLVEYYEWTAWNVFGKPIPLMVARVKFWLDNGVPVKIFTARLATSTALSIRGLKRHQCPVTGDYYSDDDMIKAIQASTERFFGLRLPVTCVKDYKMIELWDDRAIQVVSNTGMSLADEHEAQRQAERAKAFNPNAGNYSDQDDPKTNPNPI